MLHGRAGRSLVIHETVADVAALIRALDRQVPGLAADLDDPIFNVAINDEMLLLGVAGHPLQDGDRVEFVPAIAGG